MKATLAESSKHPVGKDSDSSTSSSPDETGATPSAAKEGDGASGPTRSAATLRTENHRGTRDQRIAQLRDQLEDLHAAQAVRAFRKESGLAMLDRLFSPFVDKVLPKADATLARKLDRSLDTQQAFNLMADVLHAVGADPATVDALEAGAVRIASGAAVPIVAIQTAGGGAGALYDSAKERIEVPEDTVEDVLEARDKLLAAGLVDEDGNVRTDRVSALDVAAAADEVGKIANGVAVHEPVHAHQDHTGLIDQITPTIERLRAQGDEAAAERYRVRMLEVPAYQKQETADLKNGGGRKIFVSIDSWSRGHDGELSVNYLGAEQAADNIFALQAGEPLPYGPDKGYTSKGMAQKKHLSSASDEGQPWLRHPAPGLEAQPWLRHPTSTIAAQPWLRHPSVNAADQPWLRHPSVNAADQPWLRHPSLSAADQPWLRHPSVSAADQPWLRHPSLSAADQPWLRHPSVNAADQPWLRHPSLSAADQPWLRHPSLSAADQPWLRHPSLSAADQPWLRHPNVATH